MDEKETLNEEQKSNVEILDEKRDLQKKEKKEKVKKIVIITAIALAALLFIYGILIVLDINGVFNSRGGRINIEKGDSSAAIAEKLEEKGIIESPFFFRAYCYVKGHYSSFKYGTYNFQKGMGYEEIANVLLNDGGSFATVTVTIPEGTTIRDYTKNINGSNVTVSGIASILEKNGVCSKEDFFAALDSAVLDGELFSNIDKNKVYIALEGYLFPDTYEFFCYDSKICSVLAVEKLMKGMENKFTKEMRERAKEINMSVNEVLTLASIVQLEAGTKGNEMANVAAIFYNRLNSPNFPTLGSSPTIYYGDAFEQDDGRYNTYKVRGLPVGPVCAPGLDAINAVLYPSKNLDGYYYFITDSKGNFYYHRTGAEQSRKIEQLKKENNWVYEYY